MDNQHRQIKGYRDLSQEEIDLMNTIKSLGRVIEERVDAVQERNRIGIDQGHEDAKEAARWVAIARTHLQQGLMALTRAVAKPDFF